MSEDNVQSEMKKFIDNYNKERDNVRYPLKDMFEQIKSDLETICDAITNQGYPLGEETHSMGVSVRNLNELLNKYLTISRKQRSGSKNCLNYSPADFMFLAKTAKDKLQKIMTDLKGTRAEVENHMMENFNISKDVQWTTGDVDESKIYGWDDQAKKIIKSLKEKKEGLNVVGIVGMFGTGKTTLAQKVFLSEEVMDHFPLRLWVWVSKKCDREELLRRVLDNLGVEEDHIEEMLKIDPNLGKVGVLLFLVHLELLRKRYLIVFDDVVEVEDPWHCELDKEPPEDKEWTSRLAYGLPKGDGSAIIITSSKEDDARKMVGAGKIFTPEPLLKEEDGWALFKSSFEEVMGKPLDDKNLESLWKDITRKCDGLPIALKAAGKSMAALIQKKKDADQAQKQREEQAHKQREEEAIKAESSGQSNARD